MLKNLLKSRKLNENDMKGLTYCIDNDIRIKLSRSNGIMITELYKGRVCEFNKINPSEVGIKSAQLVADCRNSFANGYYVKRNKRIEIER